MTKKAVVYTPTSDFSKVTNEVNKELVQIPPYEDQGISYRGKYKVQTGDNAYELKGQQTRWYHLGATAIGTTTFTRANKDTTRFYCTKIVVSSYGKGGFGVNAYETLGDLNGTHVSVKFTYQPVVSGEHIVVDLTDCPRVFDGDFTIYKYSAGGAEYTSMALYGWEEQK